METTFAKKSQLLPLHSGAKGEGEKLIPLHHDAQWEQEAADKGTEDAFLTGLMCLRPVSEPCLSRLARLWSGPKAPSGETEAEPVGLSPLGRFFLLDSFVGEFREFLTEGLTRYFPEEPAAAPRVPEPECEVRKDPAGEVRVECMAP